MKQARSPAPASLGDERGPLPDRDSGRETVNTNNLGRACQTQGVDRGHKQGRRRGSESQSQSVRRVAAEAKTCLRCLRGPSFHGKHERTDPQCVLHNTEAATGGEVLAYLRSQKHSGQKGGWTGPQQTRLKSIATTSASLTTPPKKKTPPPGGTGEEHLRGKARCHKRSSSRSSSTSTTGPRILPEATSASHTGGATTIQGTLDPEDDGDPFHGDVDAAINNIIHCEPPGSKKCKRRKKRQKREENTKGPSVPTRGSVSPPAAIPRGVLKGLSPLEARAARAIPQRQQAGERMQVVPARHPATQAKEETGDADNQEIEAYSTIPQQHIQGDTNDQANERLRHELRTLTVRGGGSQGDPTTTASC